MFFFVIHLRSQSQQSLLIFLKSEFWLKFKTVSWSWCQVSKRSKHPLLTKLGITHHQSQYVNDSLTKSLKQIWVNGPMIIHNIIATVEFAKWWLLTRFINHIIFDVTSFSIGWKIEWIFESFNFSCNKLFYWLKNWMDFWIHRSVT
jgi:hypothetical protein